MRPLRLGALFRAEDHRIRTIWRLLLYLSCYLVTVVLGTLANRGLQRAGVPREIAYVAALGIGVGLLLGCTWLLRRKVDRRAWSGMALQPLREGIGRFFIGAILGSGLIALLFGMMWMSGLLEVVPSGTATPSSFFDGLLLGLAGFLAVGFEEELMMRGYFFQNLAETMPLWVATLATGLVFAGLHSGVDGFNLRFAASVVVISSLLVVLRLVTGSLWTAIGWHFAWDWTQDTAFGMAGQGSDHSWIRVVFHGPTWLIGTGRVLEGGMLWIGLEILVLLALLGWAKRQDRAIQWHKRLLPNGEVEATHAGA